MTEAITTEIDDTNDESLWEQALNEVNGPERKQGLWAKSFAAANGDESRAKAAYLNERVKQMRAEIEERKQAALAAERQRIRDEQLARMNDEERAWAIMPKGVCPSCSKVIPLSSSKCSHCDALFGPDSAWSITPLSEDDPRNMGPEFVNSRGVANATAVPMPATAASKSTEEAQVDTKDERWWSDWLPIIVGVLWVKLFGLMAALIGIGVYYQAKKRGAGKWAAYGWSLGATLITAVIVHLLFRNGRY